MSEFIDKLMRIRRAEPQPMGFGLGKQAAEKLKMQLVVHVAAGNLDKVKDGLGSADAFLVDITKSSEAGALDRTCQPVEGVFGGAWIKTSSQETLKKIGNSICDFVVFPADASISLTRKDKLGRILELESSLNEGLLRTANDLPVDAVLIIGNQDESYLTFNRLMLVQRLLYLVHKPVLVSAADSITGDELQSLWDMGISGVLVETTDEKAGEKLAAIRKDIDNLAQPAFRKKEKASPVLPRLQPEAPKPQEPDEGEEEEDE